MIVKANKKKKFSPLHFGKNPPGGFLKTTQGPYWYTLLWYSENIRGMKRRSHMTFNKVKSATLNLNNGWKS